jgi:hypothetical protein
MARYLAVTPGLFQIQFSTRGAFIQVGGNKYVYRTKV